MFHIGIFLLYKLLCLFVLFFFSSRRRHTRFDCDWSSDVCSSDLACPGGRDSGVGSERGSGLAAGRTWGGQARDGGAHSSVVVAPGGAVPICAVLGSHAGNAKDRRHRGVVCSGNCVSGGKRGSKRSLPANASGCPAVGRRKRAPKHDGSAPDLRK